MKRLPTQRVILAQQARFGKAHAHPAESVPRGDRHIQKWLINEGMPILSVFKKNNVKLSAVDAH